MNEVPYPEEFTPAMQSRVMAHRNHDHPKSRQFEFFGHFNADHTASGFEGNRIEDMTAEQAEIAVDVANRQAKNPAHRAAVRSSDPDAIPGVGAYDLVTMHEIDVRTEFRKQIVHFADIVLAVAVGVEDQILLRVLEAGNQRSTVAEVPLVMNHAQVWQLDGEPIEDLARLVFAAVIDHQHFEVIGCLAHLLGGRAHDALDSVLIVISRKKRGERNPFLHAANGIFSRVNSQGVGLSFRTLCFDILPLY